MSSDLTIGIAGPIETKFFAEFLDGGQLPPDAPAGLGGSPVTGLAVELLRKGRKVSLFTLDPQVQGERTLIGERLRIVIGPYGAARGRRVFRAEISALRSMIERHRPDVVHAHWTYEFALAAVRSGRPHIVTAHDAPVAILRHQPDAYRLIRMGMAYAACRRARALVAVSPHIADHLTTWGFRSGPIEVVPNGLSVPPPSSSKVDRMNSPPSIATVLTGWGNLKNGAAALRAFRLIRQSIPGARLTTYGEGHGPGGPAERWALEHGLADGVSFRGQVPRTELLQALQQEIDLLLHPSREESHGMAILEAMAQGVPVIAGRFSGAVPWTLGQGRFGVLVDVSSPCAIADAAVALIRDLDGRRALASSALQSVKERFDISKVAAQYEVLYEACHAAQAPVKP